MVQLRLGDRGEGFGVLDDGKESVVHQIRCDQSARCAIALGQAPVLDFRRDATDL